MELVDLFYSTIKASGGPDVMAARIIYEWYPHMFSSAEFEQAKETLKKAGIKPQDQRLVLVHGSYSRKKKAVLPAAKTNRDYTMHDAMYIKKNYPAKSAKEIAKVLKRRERSIIQFIKQYRQVLGLGYTKPGPKTPTNKTN